MEPRQCDVEFRVRYVETDQMGIVHHSHYFAWFEMGRSELCRQWGLPYGEWESRGVLLPLAEARCRYKRPVLYDEMVHLTTTLADVTRFSVAFDYTLRGDDGTLRAEGWTKHAFATPDGRLIRGEHVFLTPLTDRLRAIMNQKTEKQ